MKEELAIGILAAIGTTALTAAVAAIGTLISMRLKIAVLEEKQKYHTGQIRALLRRSRIIPADENTGDFAREDSGD